MRFLLSMIRPPEFLAFLAHQIASSLCISPVVPNFHENHNSSETIRTRGSKGKQGMSTGLTSSMFLRLGWLLAQGGGGSGAEIIEDQDHRKYTMQELYDEITLKAGLCVAGYTVVMVVVVILRDILRVWTCFGESIARAACVLLAPPSRSLSCKFPPSLCEYNFCQLAMCAPIFYEYLLSSVCRTLCTVCMYVCMNACAYTEPHACHELRGEFQTERLLQGRPTIICLCKNRFVYFRIGNLGMLKQIFLSRCGSIDDSKKQRAYMRLCTWV